MSATGIEPGVKCISFDVWLTLIRSNPECKPARTRLMAKALGLSDTGFDDLHATIQQIDRDCDAETDCSGGQISPSERLTRIATHYGVTLVSDKLAELAENIQLTLVDYLPLLKEPGIPDMLAELKFQGYQIALLSNTGFYDGVYMRSALAKIGIYDHVDLALFSNEVGCSKPSPKIYHELVRRSGLAPEEILHVGDNLVADYNGARQASLQAVHLSAKPSPAEVSISLLSALPTLLQL